MQPVRISFEGQTAKGLALQLRYPAPGDVQALWEYINRLSKEQTYILFQGEEISYADEKTWLDDKLERIARKKSVMLLAFHADALIGVTEIDLLEGVRRHTGGLGISVAQAYRGRGVGEILMQKVIAEALAELAGLDIIMLEVFGSNLAAINLYKKCGFTEFGRLPGGIIHRSAHVDGVYMYRLRDNGRLTQP